MFKEGFRFDKQELTQFTELILVHCGMPPEDARTAAEILIHADLMGIDSHGIAHLMGHRDYVPGLRNGAVSPLVRLRIEHERLPRPE